MVFSVSVAGRRGGDRPSDDLGGGRCDLVLNCYPLIAVWDRDNGTQLQGERPYKLVIHT